MIVKELLLTENRIYQYSNANVKIRQIETGVVYDSALDIYPCPYTYEETDIPIDEEPLEAQQALDVIFGGNNGTV